MEDSFKGFYFLGKTPVHCGLLEVSVGPTLTMSCIPHGGVVWSSYGAASRRRVSTSEHCIRHSPQRQRVRIIFVSQVRKQNKKELTGGGRWGERQSQRASRRKLNVCAPEGKPLPRLLRALTWQEGTPETRISLVITTTWQACSLWLPELPTLQILTQEVCVRPRNCAFNKWAWWFLSSENYGSGLRPGVSKGKGQRLFLALMNTWSLSQLFSSVTVTPK